MKVSVKSFWKAQESIDAGEHDFAISLLAKEGDDRCPCRGDHHLIMQFDDAEVAEVFYEGKMWYGPTKEQVSDILDWVRQIPDDDATLLVHCTAGKSRSTAIAMAALIAHNEMTPFEALQEVKRVRHEEGSDIIVPNRLIVAYADDILGLRGEFVQVVDSFYEELSERVPLELIKRGRHTPEA